MAWGCLGVFDVFLYQCAVTAVDGVHCFGAGGALCVHCIRVTSIVPSVRLMCVVNLRPVFMFTIQARARTLPTRARGKVALDFNSMLESVPWMFCFSVLMGLIGFVLWLPEAHSMCSVALVLGDNHYLCSANLNND